MYNKFNRRSFLRILGQGTAALGISGKAWAGTENVKTRSRNIKYQTFQPGEYFDWEKKHIEECLAIAEKGPQKSDERTVVLKEQDILDFNRKWNPYNPLFNDKEYAKKAGYPGIPALPAFIILNPPWNYSMRVPDTIGDTWAYTLDSANFETFELILAGNSYTKKDITLVFRECTVPGTCIRIFQSGGSSENYDEKDKLVLRSTGTDRNAYRKIIDGSPPPSYSEKEDEWIKYFPPPHYTTDEEWEYIKELWDKEYMRGVQKLYWEDVNVGEEPPWTCSGPMSHPLLTGLFGTNANIMTMREYVLNTDPKHLYRDKYGMYQNGSRHNTGRNAPGGRAIFFNDTAPHEVARMVTNYIGDAGFVTKIDWYFKPNFKDLWGGLAVGEDLGGKYLDKVPYMKGKECTVHGSETDTIISKGYVTDKYINDRGEHIIDISCWCENFDDAIIQVVGVSARLPSRRG